MMVAIWVCIGVVALIAVMALIAATGDDAVPYYGPPRYCPYCHACPCAHKREEMQALSSRIGRLERERERQAPLLTYGEWQRRNAAPPCLTRAQILTPTPKPQTVDVTITVEAKARA